MSDRPTHTERLLLTERNRLYEDRVKLLGRVDDLKTVIKQAIWTIERLVDQQVMGDNWYEPTLRRLREEIENE